MAKRSVIRFFGWSVVATAAFLGTLGLCPGEARAQSIIRNPGDHTNTFEIEPHLTLAPFDTYGGDIGIGAGLRLGIPIVQNGFVPSINNSVAISFGFDFAHYGGCGFVGCEALNQFSIPVVLQWNFYLTRAWSVFGEPGLALSFYGNRCDGLPGCPSYNVLEPAFFAGARWHFAPNAALTMRVGWPSVSIGVSFL